MNNFLSRQSRSPASLSAFGFVLPLLRLGALFYMAALLVFSAKAWGADTYVLPKPVYTGGGCGYGIGGPLIPIPGGGSTLSQDISEILQLCQAKWLLQPWISSASLTSMVPRSAITHVDEPTLNGYPTSLITMGSITSSGSQPTTTDCLNVGGSCGGATLSLKCPDNQTSPLWYGAYWSTGKPKYLCRISTTTPVRPKDPLGPQASCNLKGNPIDMSTGIKIQPETDYTGSDGLVFTRTYRSSTGRFESILTNNWSASNDTSPQLENWINATIDSPITDNPPLAGNPAGNSGEFYNGIISSGCVSTSCAYVYPHRFPIVTPASNELFHYLYTPDGQRLQFTENSNGIPISPKLTPTL